MRAVTGFVTVAGTLCLTRINEARPDTKLRDEGYIFFSGRAILNRVFKDKLYVKAGSQEAIPYARYSLPMANRDFETLASEV